MSPDFILHKKTCNHCYLCLVFQLLKIKVSEFTVNGVKYLARLKKLHMLLIDDPKCYSIDELTSLRKFYPQILKEMPWLKGFGHHLIESKYVTSADQEYFKGIARSIMDIEGVYELEELYAIGYISKKASFPNLKTLYLAASYAEYNLASYKQLTTLFAHHCCQNFLTRVIPQVGAQLEQLSIKCDGMWDRFDLFQIFHECPNLSYLAVDTSSGGCFVQKSRFAAKVSAHNFRLLKRFQAQFMGPAPRGIVNLILDAPLLEEARFFNIELKNKECRLLQQAQDDRWQNLQSLVFSGIWNPRHRIIEDLAKAIKRIICSASMLREVSVCNFRDELVGREWEMMRMDTDFFTLLMELKYNKEMSLLLEKFVR
jgi:hypothetical protein